MRKVGVLAAVLSAALLSSAASGSADDDAGHRRQGEDHKVFHHDRNGWRLDVDITFINSFGTTVTNAKGTCYNGSWGAICEPKVYPPQYWGSFPLYFFGGPVGVTISITNRGPKKWAKIQTTSRAYDMKLDGSNGVLLYSSKPTYLTVKRGETERIDGTFVVNFVAGAADGLDHFMVDVFQTNFDKDGEDEEDDGPQNRSVHQLAHRDGIFCPPKFGPNP